MLIMIAVGVPASAVTATDGGAVKGLGNVSWYDRCTSFVTDPMSTAPT